LRPPAGAIPVTREGDLVFVAARPEWGPPWELAQLDSPAEVEALDGPPGEHDLLVPWAWIDEEAGRLRARAFGRRVGIFEDEATGSAATKLCAHAGRAVDIRQGRGSRILARPAGDGFVEIGGLSAIDEVRDYTLP
jgi:predicted PhzF superfamily epimerase YddE/YHI9